MTESNFLPDDNLRLDDLLIKQGCGNNFFNGNSFSQQLLSRLDTLDSEWKSEFNTFEKNIDPFFDKIYKASGLMENYRLLTSLTSVLTKEFNTLLKNS